MLCKWNKLKPEDRFHNSFHLITTIQRADVIAMNGKDSLNSDHIEKVKRTNSQQELFGYIRGKCDEDIEMTGLVTTEVSIMSASPSIK